MKYKINYIFLIVIFTLIFKTNFFGLLSLYNGAMPYQYDSEDLAIGAISAEFYDIQNGWTGLGRVQYKNTNKSFVSEEIYLNKNFNNENLEYYGYPSQVGLQGKIYALISKFGYNAYLVEFYRWVNSFLLSLVIVGILYLIRIKYNILMSIIWGSVFIFSPHVLNFSHNLYWVEFTWFIPILLGLTAATDNVNFKYKNLVIPILIFLSIFIKSLCGYEYLSSIMISMTMWLITDIIVNIYKRNRDELKKKLKLFFIISLCGLCGFVSALSLHSYYRGNGNILTGVYDIYQKDILRRTIAGNEDNFTTTNSLILKSIKVPTTKVIVKYFKPYSDKQNFLIKIVGKSFWPLSVIALIIMIYRICYKKFDQEENIKTLSLFLISLASTLSWVILAKSHSFIHTNMNSVLWFLGYCQMMMYIIVSCFWCKKVK